MKILNILKENLFYFICNNILKTKYGNKPPIFLCWLFFPLKTYISKNNFYNYNFLTNVFTVKGIKIPVYLLDNIKENCDYNIFRFQLKDKKLEIIEIISVLNEKKGLKKEKNLDYRLKDQNIIIE